MAIGKHEEARSAEIIVGAGVDLGAATLATAGSTKVCWALPGGAPIVRPRGAGTYFTCALLNPYHLILLASGLLLSLIGWTGWTLLFVAGAEVVFLGIVPWCGFFRRRADLVLDRADRAASARAREALIQQMGEGHRRELARMDALIERTRAAAQRTGEAAPLILGDGVGLERLTMSYIRLAIAHRSCEESLSMTDRRALDATIHSLEVTLGEPATRVRDVVERRLSIARSRAACWGRAREHLELITHQLATILELVHLVYEQSFAPLELRRLSGDIDQFLVELADAEGARRELDELAVAEGLDVLEELEDERGGLRAQAGR